MWKPEAVKEELIKGEILELGLGVDKICICYNELQKKFVTKN